MKKFLFILLCSVFIIGLLVAFAGCNGLHGDATVPTDVENEKSIQISDGASHLDFEIYKIYHVDISISGYALNSIAYQELKLEYDSEAIDMKCVSSDSYDNEIKVTIRGKNFAEGNSANAKFRDLEFTFTYSVVDYSFEGNNCKTPESLDDLDEFPEFKTTASSMQYFDFDGRGIDTTSETYACITENGAVYRSFRANEYGSVEYDLTYLSFLTSSCLYPADFSMVNRNPISARGVVIEYGTNDCNTSIPTVKKMQISYDLINQCAVSDDHACHKLNFKMISIDNVNDENEYWTENLYFNLFKIYPDKFFEYEIGGVKMYIIIVENKCVYAFFSDSDFYYRLYCGYEK